MCTPADPAPGDWPRYARDLEGTRFSPLDQITADNVSGLSLAWTADTGTTRGLEASPIVVDGVMFTSGSWSVVFAHDAKMNQPNDIATAIDFALTLLTDSDRKLKDDLRKCQLETCGGYFLIERNRSGGQPSKYHDECRSRLRAKSRHLRRRDKGSST